MSTSNESDPQGYRRLNQTLMEIEQRLLAAGDSSAAAAVHGATLFYGGGSPTEFLGEARLALRALADLQALPDDLQRRVRETILAIDEGFRRVGGG
jgi:hypothetical protein